jgi:hypothetical protein
MQVKNSPLQAKWRVNPKAVLSIPICTRTARLRELGAGLVQAADDDGLGWKSFASGSGF